MNTLAHLVKVTGISSVVGGIAWTVACFVHNSLPQGCIDDACLSPQTSPLRGNSAIAVALVGVAFIMLAASGVGMLLILRRTNALGRTGAAAVLAAGSGCVLLVAAGVVSGFVDSNWSGMPGLVVPGVLLLALGAALLGWGVYRSQFLPTWVSLSLLGTALLLPFANEQTSRILLAVPFGVMWSVAGVVLHAQHAPSMLDATVRSRDAMRLS